HRIVPTAVAVPRGVEELQRLVRWAADSGRHLVRRGAGSGMAGGSVGRDVVVDLSQGFRWTAPDWSRRTVWAGASVTWAEVTEAARPFGLRLPPDPSSGGFATSGGMAATNAAGPRSVRCGSVRHWVTAIEIIGADGEPRRVTRGEGSGERFGLSPEQRRIVATRFPKTRKNSAGYALNHFADSGDELDLLIGSEGTLAIVTAVEWRLEPIPPDVAGVALGFRTLEQLTEAVPFLVALNPSAVELLDRTLLDVVRPAGVDLPEGLEIESLRLGDYVAGIRSAAARHAIPIAVFGHAGDGHVHVNTLPDVTSPGWSDGLAALYRDAAELLLDLGGTPSGEHGVGRLRAGLLERFYGPEVAALFREVKQVYDAGSTLNPGVIIPSADWTPLADLKVGPGAAPIPDDIAARLREIERTAAWATPKLELARSPDPESRAPRP